MSFAPNTMKVSKSAQAMEADIKLRKRMWYALKPVSIVVAGLFLLSLFIVPVARGQDMGEIVMKDVGIAFVATLMVALLLGWMSWLLIRRTDMVANFVFCAVLIACGVWTTGLSTNQRSKAQAVFHDSVGKHLVVVSDKARDLFEVGD